MDAAADQAIAACGGDAGEAVKALLVANDFLEARFEQLRVGAGDLGENISTAGLALERMPLGTLIELGPMAIVELTGLRTPCVLIDRFRAGLKQQVLSSAETGPPFNPGCWAWYGPAGWSRLVILRGFAFRPPRFGLCRPCRKTLPWPENRPCHIACSPCWPR
ncbi:hypothetical protein ACVWW4_003542 [Bradyrhizobium sp. LB7.1]